MNSNGAAPLGGIQVVDLGQYLAGPAAAMVLADLGAEVVRIEPPAGPSWDEPCVRVLNRNKKSITLDLKTERDRTTAQQMIVHADVLVENFRPGVMDRLGLGPEEMLTSNPRLVYLSLPGFSRNDPERANVQAWEGVVAAAVGQFTDMGLNRVLMGIDPSFSPLPLASSYAAVLGALSVVLALRARERDGRGDFIEVPLAAALAEGLAYNSMHVEDLPRRYLSLREREIEHRRRRGDPLNLTYGELQRHLDAFYRPYVCSDGRPFAVVCVSSAVHPERALRLLGLWDEAREAGLPTFDPYLPTSDWPEGTDCTVFAHPLSPTWNEWLSTRIADVIAQQPSGYWEQVFGDARAPAVAHRTTAEWLEEGHPRDAGLLIEAEDPILGPLKQPGKLVWFEGDDEDRAAMRASSGEADANAVAPASDRAVGSQALGAGPNGAADTSTAKTWLSDVAILDMTNVIAGPTIAATLARFGARITKLDPIKPTFDPWNTILCGLQANRGKLSLLADVTSPAGEEILDRLIARSDVVVVNATSAQVERLGLTRERLLALNPNVILCQLDAWSGPNGGPWSERLGYDDTVQAATGITARFGGGLETPEEHAHFGTIDVLGGFCGALATAAALFAVARGRAATTARSSLAAAGQLLQLPFMLDFPGRGPFQEPSGRTALGHGPCYRCYRTHDSWIFFACSREDLPRVLADFQLPPGLAGPTLEAGLVEAFGQLPTDELIGRLWRLDVGAHRLERLPELRQRYLGADGEAGPGSPTLRFDSAPNHPSGHLVELIAPCAIRPLRTQLAALTPAPKYGQHTVQILKELGYQDNDIDRLRRSHVVSNRWSNDYLPD